MYPKDGTINCSVSILSGSIKAEGCVISVSLPPLQNCRKLSYLRTEICTRNKAFRLKLISCHKLLRAYICRGQQATTTTESQFTTVNVVCALEELHYIIYQPATAQQLIHIFPLFLRGRRIPRYLVAILIPLC